MSFFSKFIKKDKDSGRKPEDKKKLEKGEELTLAEMQAKKEKEANAATGASRAKKEDTKQAYSVLLKPLVTEKGTLLASDNKYLFSVGRNANKIEIKKAVQALYGVAPTKVNIIRTRGKHIRYGKVSGTTTAGKKAMITLKKGDSIQVYEGV